MKITKEALNKAVEKNILTMEQADNLFLFLKSQSTSDPVFNFTNVLYYFGGLIAIGAMTLFMNLGWESFGGWGIFYISLLYMGVGLKLTTYFQSKMLSIPAGICATFVVALSPLAIYGLQKALGLWPEQTSYLEYHRYIKWYWIYLELGTLAIGAMVIWRYRYPFINMPIAITLWYFSMDLAELIMGEYFSWQFKALLSIYFGILMIGLAFWVDIRTRKSLDYAFWLYLFGVLSFWFGLTSQNSNSELAKFFYLLINLMMIATGVVLTRKVFVVFGAFGTSAYLGHLAFSVFKESWLFPVALTAIGLLIIYLGILWQKNETKITRKARNLLPKAIKELLDTRLQ